MWAIFYDPFAKYYELDIADDRDTAPGHWCCPEGSMIGDSARNSGKVWVRRGKEVKTNVRGKDILRKRRSEKGRKTGL